MAREPIRRTGLTRGRSGLPKTLGWTCIAIAAAIACGDSGQAGNGPAGSSGGGSEGTGTSSGATMGSSGSPGGSVAGASGNSSGGTGGSGSGASSSGASSSGASSSGGSGGGAGASGSGSGASSGGPDLGAPAYSQLVNPFIGTALNIQNKSGFAYDSGDVFPGAAYPLGMLYFSPDTPSKLPGGYKYEDNKIQGFSLTHFSGRGCTAYLDVPIMPIVGGVTTSPATVATYAATFSHANESANAGYYKVKLDTNVTVELTATPRTGVGRFTFPASSQSSTLLVNSAGSVNGVTASSVTIDGAAREIYGSAASHVGCGTNAYTIYFSAKFGSAFSGAGTWNGNAVSQALMSSTGTQSGAFVTFDTSQAPTVEMRVGISYVSLANARANLAAENPGMGFDAVRAAAEAAWDKRLSVIEVQGGSHNEQVAYYTALYHALLHPNLYSDGNGDYMGFDGKVHTAPAGHAQYHNIPGWDQYRTTARLRAVITPAESSDVAQSLVNDAQQGDGHVPRWQQTNADSHGMVGDGGSIWLADAYALGATAFDTAGALAAMDGGQAKLRENLLQYVNLGYIANDVSVTLEYANADFAIAQFAAALGDAAKATMYGARAQNWQKLFNKATGYLQPKDALGAWVAGFSPISQAGFVEGTASHYRWMVPFNLRGLFDLMGGNTAVVQALDTFFTKNNDGLASPYCWMGNEPSLNTPFSYAFAGAPARTQKVARDIELQLFTTAPSGIPGNDDGGTTSSWLVFAAIGIYPELPGVGGFVIGSPLFTSVTVHLAGGKLLQIHAPAAADNAPYVQGLKVNGTPTTSLWLPWSAVAAGGTLDFDLGTSASSWGTGAADAPPSFAH